MQRSPMMFGAVAGSALLFAASVAAAWQGSDPAGMQLFEREVRPILAQKCVVCHSGEKPQGGLKLTTREGMLKGGVSGPVLIPGKTDTGSLLAAINYRGKRMPPQGQLPAQQIAALTRWIELGAPWPQGAAASLEPRQQHGPPPVTAETMKFWSFQPVKRPAVPKVKNLAWVRSPVDAFVLARLEAAGLQPNPSADRRTLIRRATYDLIGLPPSPEEVDAFVQDRSPQAYEQLIDRLLASPRYGEKWGRHWLDLVRFAESNSYERDGTKPEAWRYRDYVVNSFNADKPYDQFLTEQLAGDELSPRTPERLIATGYYRLGIWDDEPADPQQALYDDLDDIAKTTGEVVLGMTVGCARCHDHKLDPLPQRDYYRFLAFFNGIRRYGVRSDESVVASSLRPLAPPDVAERLKRETEQHQSRLREKQQEIDRVERRVRATLTGGERDDWVSETARPDIIRKKIGGVISQAEFDAYLAQIQQRTKLRMSAPPSLEMALCVTELGARPRDTFVLARGNPSAPGEKVEPGFPTVLAPPAPTLGPSPHGDTSGRRLALAKWLTSPTNPLTARVMANRVWHYHFGRGIVRSLSDFGFQGDRPTHPELLDWIADRFVSDGWKLKSLHRVIMLSNTYRMSSKGTSQALAKDPRNDLFWRVEMRRLLAEEVRDSILAVNGQLNLKEGGPSFYPTLPAEVLAGQSRPGENWGRSSAEEQARRSVYIFVKRSLAVPIIANFDGPEPDFTCPIRFVTTQPTQALGMLNSSWVQEQARAYAAFLKKQAGADPAAQVRLALRRSTQRTPTTAEVERGLKLMRDLQERERLQPDAALSAFCLVALNLNEFLYLD